MDFILTEQNKQEFTGLGVSAVVLFGSQAMGSAHAGSDLDFGVLLTQAGAAIRRQQRGDMYDAIYNLLAGRFGDDKGLDVVFLEEVSPLLQYHVVKHGKVLFETSAHAFPNFKAQAILRYADFEPYRNMFNKAIMENIGHASN